MLKRYQRFGRNGIEWSNWFRCQRIGEKYQYKSGKTVLLNEYKEEEGDE